MGIIQYITETHDSLDIIKCNFIHCIKSLPANNFKPNWQHIVMEGSANVNISGLRIFKHSKLFYSKNYAYYFFQKRTIQYYFHKATVTSLHLYLS